MSHKKPPQKLVSFSSENQAEFGQISSDMEEGWNLINLIRNGNHYVGIMEKTQDNSIETESIFIPPRKKLSIK